MSQSDGGPAFPEPERFMPDGTPLGHEYGYRAQGISVRDYFAAHALAGMLYHEQAFEQPSRVGAWAYEYADAMLAAREDTP